MSLREAVLGLVIGAAVVLAPVAVLTVFETVPFSTIGSHPLFADSFQDTSLVQSMQGVTVGNGKVDLSAGASAIDAIHNPTLTLTLAQTGNPRLIGAPSVLRVGGTWYMYYHWTPDDFYYYIGLATSTDGVNWSVDPSPVVSPSGNVTRAAYPDVIYANGEFLMWYGAYDGVSYTIYRATSSNGVNWSAGAQVLGTDIDGGVVYWAWDASVLWTGAQYRIWYTSAAPGYSGGIRAATSPDGVTWTRLGFVLQAETVGGIPMTSVASPSVVPDGTGYAMWYGCGTATNGYVCRARSPDGIAWTQEGVALSPEPSNPLMDIGVGLPSAVLQDDGSYRVYVEARGSQPPAGSGYGDQIWSGTTTLAEAHIGTLTSVSINAGPKGYRYFEASWDVPAGTFLSIDVLDANGNPILGFAGMTTSQFSLAGIDGTVHPTIHLRATFTGTSTATPILYAWEVF